MTNKQKKSPSSITSGEGGTQRINLNLMMTTFKRIVNLEYCVLFYNTLTKLLSRETLEELLSFANNSILPNLEQNVGGDELPPQLFWDALYKDAPDCWIKLSHNIFYKGTYQNGGDFTLYPTTGKGNNRKVLTNAPPLNYQALLAKSKNKVGGVFLGCSDGSADFPLKDYQKTSKDIICELDKGTFKEQHEKLRNIEAITGLKLWKISSGGKSIHAHFLLTTPIPIEKIIYFRRALSLYLDSDFALCNPHQPCRIPGFFRKEKGKYQSLLAQGGEYTEAQIEEAIATLYAAKNWELNGVLSDNDLWRRLTSSKFERTDETIREYLLTPPTPQNSPNKRTSQGGGTSPNKQTPNKETRCTNPLLEKICRYYLEVCRDRGYGAPGSGSYSSLLPMAGAIQSILGVSDGQILLNQYLPDRSFGDMGGNGVPQLIKAGLDLDIPVPPEVALINAPQIEKVGVPEVLIVAKYSESVQSEVKDKYKDNYLLVTTGNGYLSEDFLKLTFDEASKDLNEWKEQEISNIKLEEAKIHGDTQRGGFYHAKKDERKKVRQKWSRMEKNKTPDIEKINSLKAEDEELTKIIDTLDELNHKEQTLSKLEFKVLILPEAGCCIPLTNTEEDYTEKWEPKAKNIEQIRVLFLCKQIEKITANIFIGRRELWETPPSKSKGFAPKEDEKPQADEHYKAFYKKNKELKLTSYWFAQQHKFTPDLVINAKYCSEPEVLEQIIELITKHKNVALKAPLGAGKTELLTILANDNLRDLTLHLSSYRQSLCAGLSGRFGGVSDYVRGGDFSYTPRDVLILPFALTCLQKVPNADVAFCVDSIESVPLDTDPRLHIADEFESIVKHLLKGNTQVKFCREAKQEAFIKEIITADYNIFTDAHLTDESLKTIEKVTKEKVFKIEIKSPPQYPKVTRIIQWDEHNGESLSKDPLYTRMCDDLRAGGISCLQSDSVRLLETVKQALITETDKGHYKIKNVLSESEIFYISSRNSAEDLQGEFRENPDKFIKNNPQYKVYLLSPTIESGADISLKGYFKSAYYYFCGAVSIKGATQMLMRIRDVDCPRFISIPPKPLINSEDLLSWDLIRGDEYSYKQEDLNDLKCLLALAWENGDEEESDRLNKRIIDFYASPNNGFIIRRGHLDNLELIEREYFLAIITKYWEKLGISIETDFYSKGNGKSSLKPARAETIINDSVDRYTARDLSEDEYERLKKSFNTTWKEQCALYKYKLAMTIPDAVPAGALVPLGDEEPSIWTEGLFMFLELNKDAMKHITRQLLLKPENDYLVQSRLKRDLIAILNADMAPTDIREEHSKIRAIKAILAAFNKTIYAKWNDEEIARLPQVVGGIRIKSPWIKSLKKNKTGESILKALYYYLGLKKDGTPKYEELSLPEHYMELLGNVQKYSELKIKDKIFRPIKGHGPVWGGLDQECYGPVWGGLDQFKTLSEPCFIFPFRQEMMGYIQQNWDKIRANTTEKQAEPFSTPPTAETRGGTSSQQFVINNFSYNKNDDDKSESNTQSNYRKSPPIDSLIEEDLVGEETVSFDFEEDFTPPDDEDSWESKTYPEPEPEPAPAPDPENIPQQHHVPKQAGNFKLEELYPIGQKMINKMGEIIGEVRGYLGKYWLKVVSNGEEKLVHWTTT